MTNSIIIIKSVAAFLTAVIAGKMEAVRALLQNPAVDVNKHQSLHMAIMFRKVEMAKLLVDHGADINQPGTGVWEAPLLVALSNSQHDVVSYMLERGADPNIPSRNATIYPLSYAHTVPTLELLLMYGANVNPANSKMSFLISAVSGSVDVLRKLLQAGANVNAVDKDGYTPLITAAEQGKDDVVKLLLQYGADIEVRGPSGRSVYEIASTASTKKIIESHRPEPVPLLEYFAADLVVKPSKVVVAPQKHQPWIGRIFGKADSIPSPAVPNEATAAQEGLRVKQRRMSEASDVSPEQCATEKVKEKEKTGEMEREKPSGHGVAAEAHRTAMPSTAQPSVAPATGTSTAAAANPVTPVTPATPAILTQSLTARMLRLEKVVEDQSALIAKLMKIVEAQCPQKSDADLI